MISVADYFKGYADSPEITDEMRANAGEMLDKVNALMEYAEDDGVAFRINTKTGTRISGERNGGFRPQACAVGAPKSTHKTAHAVDVYDPDRRFASWCLANLDRLRDLGLHMEDSQWTPTWVHLQDVPPGSGKVVYVPSTSPALAPLPPVFA